MVFVSVGTIHKPFQRMVKVVDGLVKNGLDDIVIQSGFTDFSSVMNYSQVVCRPFYSTFKMQHLMKTATTIIVHGGEATVMEALAVAKQKPIVFPRDPQLNEHVDNQQLLFAQELLRRGWAEVGYFPNEFGLIMARDQKKTWKNIRYANVALERYLRQITTV